MSIDEMTIGEVKQLCSIFTGKPTDTSYVAGQNYLFETATKYYLGRLERITGETLVISDACWIADTGRFADFMRSGKPSEAEPCGAPVHIPRTSINAVIEWSHSLVKEQI